MGVKFAIYGILACILLKVNEHNFSWVAGIEATDNKACQYLGAFGLLVTAKEEKSGLFFFILAKVKADVMVKRFN